MKDISIIICCYNSKDRIIPTLQHIIKQEDIDSLKVEIILVDNNSNDNTKKIVTEFWTNYKTNIDFCMVDETQSGLSFARKAGVLSSNSEFIIFCDDDNWLDKFYVRNAFNLMRKDPEIGVLGGEGFPVLEAEEPHWFNKYKLIYAVGPQNKKNGDITFTSGYVYGAGCIIRKKVLYDLYQMGFKNLLAGRTENEVISGEDCEICYNIAFAGFKICYNDQLKFEHFIPTTRLTLNHLKRFRKGQAATYDIIKSYERILFSKGLKRRNNLERLVEIQQLSNQLLRISYLKVRGKIDFPDFVFSYNYLVIVLKDELLNWNRHNRIENQINNFYQKIKFYKCHLSNEN